jgi:hypothetical protein
LVSPLQWTAAVIWHNTEVALYSTFFDQSMGVKKILENIDPVLGTVCNIGNPLLR